jgi:hypothetical protein
MCGIAGFTRLHSHFDEVGELIDDVMARWSLLLISCGAARAIYDAK